MPVPFGELKSWYMMCYPQHSPDLHVRVIELFCHLPEIVVLQCILERKRIVPVQGWVTVRLPISCLSATACFHPAKRSWMCADWAKNVTLTPSFLNKPNPVSTWLSRASSKLKLTAARFPSGQ